MKKIVGLLVLCGLAFALLRWPLVRQVETGGTPEYPELQPRSYRAGEAEVAQAVRRAVAALPGFRYVGSGSGPGGRAIQAAHERLGVAQDLTIRIWREAGRTRVSVRSSNRLGRLDLGQNARNVRALFAFLDRELQ